MSLFIALGSQDIIPIKMSLRASSLASEVELVASVRAKQSPLLELLDKLEIASAQTASPEKQRGFRNDTGKECLSR